MGIVHRKGLGEMRHIETQYLWIQGNVNDKTIALNKVCTKENPAYLVTKGVKKELLDEHLKTMQGYTSTPRADSALSISTVGVSDWWEMKGDEGTQLWIRRHAKWRESLFTPTKVAGGPRSIQIAWSPLRLWSVQKSWGVRNIRWLEKFGWGTQTAPWALGWAHCFCCKIIQSAFWRGHEHHVRGRTSSIYKG